MHEDFLGEKDNNEDLIPTTVRILVVCFHGITRSKVVKDLLKDFDYQHVGKIGVIDLKNPSLNGYNREILSMTDILLSVSDDVAASLKNMQNKGQINPDMPIIGINISETDHAILRQKDSPQKPEAEARILTQLAEVGFRKQDPQTDSRSDLE